MKFLIPTQELNYLLNKVQSAVPQKPAIPVLSNIRIDVSNGMLKLAGSDLTLGIECETDVKVLEEGSIALPARRLVPLVRELTAPQVEFTAHEDQIAEIVSGSSRFRIHGVRTKEYPSLPDMAGAASFQMAQKELKALFHQVSFAIAREENRFVFTGALMRVANGQITLIGTDAKRLARAHAKVEADSTLSGSYVIPLKAVEEIARNLTEDKDATLFLLPDKIAVEAGRTRLVTKLLAGEYPDVHRVIPERSDIILTLHREELISLLKQVSLFTTDEHHSVRFTFTDGELKLSANSMDVGEGKVSMPVNYRGPELQVAFSPAFVIDALRNTHGETVALGLTDSYNPGVITDKEGDLKHPHGATPLYVVMPMRVQNATA